MFVFHDSGPFTYLFDVFLFYSIVAVVFWEVAAKVKKGVHISRRPSFGGLKRKRHKK